MLTVTILQIAHPRSIFSSSLRSKNINRVNPRLARNRTTSSEIMFQFYRLIAIGRALYMHTMNTMLEAMMENI